MRLLYFGQIMRVQDSLGKTIMLGKVEGSRKRGRPNPQFARPEEDVNDSTFWKTFIHRVTIREGQLDDT